MRERFLCALLRNGVAYDSTKYHDATRKLAMDMSHHHNKPSLKCNLNTSSESVYFNGQNILLVIRSPRIRFPKTAPKPLNAVKHILILEYSPRKNLVDQKRQAKIVYDCHILPDY